MTTGIKLFEKQLEEYVYIDDLNPDSRSTFSDTVTLDDGTYTIVVRNYVGDYKSLGSNAVTFTVNYYPKEVTFTIPGDSEFSANNTPLIELIYSTLPDSISVRIVVSDGLGNTCGDVVVYDGEPIKYISLDGVAKSYVSGLNAVKIYITSTIDVNARKDELDLYIYK